MIIVAHSECISSSSKYNNTKSSFPSHPKPVHRLQTGETSFHVHTILKTCCLSPRHQEASRISLELGRSFVWSLPHHKPGKQVMTGINIFQWFKGKPQNILWSRTVQKPNVPGRKWRHSHPQWQQQPWSVRPRCPDSDLSPSVQYHPYQREHCCVGTNRVRIIRWEFIGVMNLKREPRLSQNRAPWNLQRYIVYFVEILRHSPDGCEFRCQTCHNWIRFVCKWESSEIFLHIWIYPSYKHRLRPIYCQSWFMQCFWSARYLVIFTESKNKCCRNKIGRKAEPWCSFGTNFIHSPHIDWREHICCPSRISNTPYSCRLFPCNVIGVPERKYIAHKVICKQISQAMKSNSSLNGCVLPPDLGPKLGSISVMLKVEESVKNMETEIYENTEHFSAVFRWKTTNKKPYNWPMMESMVQSQEKLCSNSDWPDWQRIWVQPVHGSAERQPCWRWCFQIWAKIETQWSSERVKDHVTCNRTNVLLFGWKKQSMRKSKRNL